VLPTQDLHQQLEMIDVPKLPFHHPIARHPSVNFRFYFFYVFPALLVASQVFGESVKELSGIGRKVMQVDARVEPLAVRSSPLFYYSLENEPSPRGMDPRILRGYQTLDSRAK
jgi:hypothetical protein